MANHKARLSLFQDKARALRRVDVVGPLPLGPWRPSNVHAAILAVDGGLAHAPAADFSVGDGDSHPQSAQAQFDLRLPIEKDRSDLSHALELIPAGVEALHLYGLWGGRFDHQMMNQGALHQYFLTHRGQATWYGGPSERLRVCSPGAHRLELLGTFSLWALTQAQLIIRGACQYQLTTPTALSPLSSLTLSNRGAGEVEVVCDQPFFIYTEVL